MYRKSNRLVRVEDLNRKGVYSYQFELLRPDKSVIVLSRWEGLKVGKLLISTDFQQTTCNDSKASL